MGCDLPAMNRPVVLEIRGEVKYLDRDCLQMRVVRRAATEGPAVWRWVDEYEIVLDQEVGVLLQYIGVVDGERAGSLTVRSLRIDDSIPDDVFSFAPRSPAPFL